MDFPALRQEVDQATMSKRILCVGNCVPDNRAITAMIKSHFAAEVTPVDDLPETLEQLRANAYDLVLVNRILDRDGSPGLDVIQQIKAAPDLSETPVMMITDFPRHQQSAQDAGALEGFGKQALYAPKTVSKLAAVLG